MKHLFHLLLLIIGFPNFLNGQTVIRFQPDKIDRNVRNVFSKEGKIKQTGKEFLRHLRVELPDKILELNLKKSRLKQYDKIISSDGEVESKVEFYEDKNQQGSYYVAIIDKQFYSLSIIENEEYFSLEKQKNVQFIYQKNETGENSNLDINDYYLPENDSISRSYSKKTSRRAVSGCFEFPIGFICDYEHFRQKQKTVSEIEADNLIMLATSQEVWSKNSFNGDIKFKTIGQLIYTSPDQTPWNDDASLPLSNIWNELSSSWKNIESWRKYNLLTKVGLTGVNYDKSSSWGWGGGTQSVFSMGTVVMKAFLINKNQLKWLFAHELGHVFGASHDNSNFVMNPFYETSSLFWSTDSKNTVNNTLNRLDSFNWLKPCHTLSVSWALIGSNFSFNWQTNYDSIGDTFTLEFSSDNQETWKVLSTIKSNGSYKYQQNVWNLLNIGQTYYFRVSQEGNNTIKSESVAIIITGIEKELINKTILISPNPFDNQLKISALPSTEIRIYDILGRLIKQIKQTDDPIMLDTPSWTTGIYLVQIGDSPNQTFKILKQ